MKIIGYLLLTALGVLVLLLLAAVIRTLCMKKKTSDYTPHPDPEREREYAEKLSRMVAYETVSHPDDPELEKFRGFHKLLAELYPTVHEKLEKTEIDGNLLFFWEGKNHDRPLVLMSHQDVVPAEGTWEHAPFSGDIADGKVWGRGASDTKCSVMGFFQACEELLREGYVPEQDVYLSSSCTEEFAGPGGGKLVDELRRRGVKPFLVCDEGGGIISEPIGGIHGNFAMLGVFEKGKADVKFTAKSTGGHASAPTANTPIARLSAFVTDVEKQTFSRSSMALKTTVLFPAPDGPEITKSLPFSFISPDILLFGFILDPRRQRFRRYCRQNYVSAVHNDNGPCASAKRRVYQKPLFPHILYHALYRCRFRTDYGNDTLNRNKVAEPDRN